MHKSSKTEHSSSKTSSTKKKKAHGKVISVNNSKTAHPHPPPSPQESIKNETSKISKLFKSTAPKSINTKPSMVMSTRSSRTNLTATKHPVMLSRKLKIERKKEEQELLHKSRVHRTVNYLAKKTHFEPEAIKTLLEMFRKLSSVSPMDRQRFRQLLHKTFGLNSNIMLDRLFMAFDGDNQGTVTETEWVLGLSVMLKGTFDEKIRFTYEVYDVNGDNSIGRDEVNACLKGCFKPVAAIKNEDEEDFEDFEKEIVDIAMRKLDVDRDGFVHIGDFYQATYSDPLLLQALGPCLPSMKATKDFLALLEVNYQNFISGLSAPGDVGWDQSRPKQHRVGVHRHHHHIPLNVESIFDRKKSTFYNKRNNGEI